MAGHLATLLAPEEKLEYSAPVLLRKKGYIKECVALVISRKLEGVLVVLDDGPFPRIEAAVSLYEDLVTTTAQMQESSEFSCEFHSTSSRSSATTISVGDIEILHSLLHAVKKYVALADDLHYHARGRSHQWTTKYWPIEVASNESKTQSEIDCGTSTSTESSIPHRDDLAALHQNPFVSQNTSSGHYDQAKRAHLKSEYLQTALKGRTAEYTHSHSISLKCSTWNMAGKDIVESLRTLLRNNPTEDEEITLYCTAFQEMDLRAEAYLTTTDAKAQNYQAYIEGAIGEYYELIASHQLVGMLLCVYAHKSIVPTITNVYKSYVPCGILGMIGNKGAVGVRFEVMNTSFAVVNCHLAAGQGGSEKRNTDLHDIEKRIFNESGVWDSGLDGIENIIIMGDLNYRIEATREVVDAMLARKDFPDLYKHDQLIHQRSKGNVLSDYQEGKITFLPTYKFDVGTDRYDSSEKQRIPSWTDRILMKTTNDSMELVDKSYTCISEYYQSDHKPVVAKFKSTVRIIEIDKMEAIRNEVYKNFDKFENEAIPNVRPKLGGEELDFGAVLHRRPVSRAFTVYNSGNSTSQFSFSRDHSGGAICKPWFWPVPNFGVLLPKQEAVIRVTVLVNDRDAVLLNSRAQTVNDVLVLHVEGGADSYISLDGAWQPTCMGQSLEVLSRSHGVRSGYASKSSPSSDLSNSIPKEIHRICDVLLTQKTRLKLFTSAATIAALNTLQDNLDSDTPFDSALPEEDKVVALCNLLVDILGTLTTPIVPESLYSRVVAGEHPMAIMDAMPSLHLNVCIYLQGFLTALLRANPDDLKLRDRLCKVFGKVMVRRISEEDEEAHMQQRADFMSRLLSGS